MGFKKTADGFAEKWRNRRSNATITLTPGPNPTVAIYNASIVNCYNATGSLARFEKKNSTL
jgi:hypothetical protein